jgi:hypothetical protein
MPIYRVKNTGVSGITVVGQYISAMKYHEIQSIELNRWANDPEVMNLISNGILVVNKGQDDVDDITNPVEGWKYLQGDIKPPTDTLGRWTIVIGNPSEDPAKRPFLLTASVFLDSFSEYRENIFFDDEEEKSIYIEQIIATSPEVNYRVSLEKIRTLSSGKEIVFNDFMNMKNTWQMKVDENFVSANRTSFVVSAARGLKFEYFPSSAYYIFEGDTIGRQLSGKTIYVEKIIDIDSSSKIVTLENPLTVNLDREVKIIFAERPIVTLTGDKNTSVVKTDYPFKVNSRNIENSYLSLKIENLDDQQAGLISVTVYGYQDS